VIGGKRTVNGDVVICPTLLGRIAGNGTEDAV